MSNAPSTVDANPSAGRATDRTTDVLRAWTVALDALRRPVRFAGFWSAVLLPLVYVPALAGNLAGLDRSTLAVLLAVHAVALLCGHGYRGE